MIYPLSKQAVKLGILDKFKAGVDTFTGKSVEIKIDEYSEKYGEVLLGIHREVDSQNFRLQKLEQCIDPLKTAQMQQEIVKLSIKSSRLQTMCVIAYILILGMGAILWTMR